MMKKLLSLLLSILMLMSIFSTSAVLAKDNETEILGPGAADNTLPEVAEGCNRYFFLAPDDWSNEYTNDIGIYWWENTGACESWPGYKAHKADAENVYYYDVPKDVWSIIWNNYLDGGNDPSADIFQNVRKTSSVSAECYAPGESEHYPDGLPSFDGMIYVVDPEPDFSTLEPTIVGDWYYYYGNGEYGTLPEVAEDCNRYFFYMPDFWYNDYTDTAGIYWWEGTDAQATWPGLKANKADAEGVYYYDVPKDVEAIIWNNYMDLLLEEWESLRHLDLYTKNISCSYYEPGESETYPQGIENFDGMIFVISGLYDGSDYVPNRLVFVGEWYYYYGNGEYGITPNRGEGEVYTEEIVVKEDSLLPPYLGDADENGIVNIKDATNIQKIVAGMDVPEILKPIGDVDGSGDITVKDATAIQKYLAGIDTGYKIGKFTWYKK